MYSDFYQNIETVNEFGKIKMNKEKKEACNYPPDEDVMIISSYMNHVFLPPNHHQQQYDDMQNYIEITPVEDDHTGIEQFYVIQTNSNPESNPNPNPDNKPIVRPITESIIPKDDVLLKVYYGSLTFLALFISYQMIRKANGM